MTLLIIKIRMKDLFISNPLSPALELRILETTIYIWLLKVQQTAKNKGRKEKKKKDTQRVREREEHAYHCCGGIAGSHHHKGSLLHGYRQRNPHINHHGPFLNSGTKKNQLFDTHFSPKTKW